MISPHDSHIEAITDQNLTYFFNPCENSKKLPAYNVTGPCDKGYMLCVYNSEYKNFTMLGNNETAFIGQKDGKMYMNFGKTNDK